MESEPMLAPREKSLLPEKISPEEDQTHDAALSRTVSSTHYQQAFLAPVNFIKSEEYFCVDTRAGIVVNFCLNWQVPNCRLMQQTPKGKQNKF